MPAVRWPDGRVDRARSYGELIAKLNALPWNAHLNGKAFRDELAHRAYVWSGDVLVHPDAPPKDFVMQLEQAGMLRLMGGKKPTP